jgi:DNA-binding response OmpR family regulator
VKKVLVVEDQDLIRSMLHWTLKKEFSIIEACDGEEAISQIQTFHPDAVIVDLNIAGKITGNEVCEWVNSHRSVYIILIIPNEEYIPNEYANDYLVLPFSANDIKQKLGTALYDPPVG